jgi:uncharacterized membrane protein YgdD (TMEM256/DUF423 family)
MNRTIALAACIAGFLGVLLGALGAHAVKSLVRELPDAADRLGWWETAARYHLVHALALAFTSLADRAQAPRAPLVSALCFGLGIILFSGSLYVMSLTGLRALGAVTPLGGVLFLCGWAVFAWAVRPVAKSSVP